MTPAERALLDFVLKSSFDENGEFSELRERVLAERLTPEAIQEAERINALYHTWRDENTQAKRKFGEDKWALACSKIRVK